jgi:hypothetical protein
MASFNFIVVSIALVILILTLAYLAVNMSTTNANVKFPPTYNNCPDGWTMNSQNLCVAPSSGNIGSPPISPSTKFVTSDADKSLSIAPLDTAWTGSTGLSAICAKKKWANTNNISWDGISNYNSC